MTHTHIYIYIYIHTYIYYLHYIYNNIYNTIDSLYLHIILILSSMQKSLRGFLCNLQFYDAILTRYK